MPKKANNQEHTEKKLEDCHMSVGRVHAKGVVLCERTCFCLLSKHLLSAFYKTLPSKNPSENLVFTENHLQAPSKNPSKKHLLLESLLRTLLRSVLLHDPLGVHASQVSISWG